MKLAALLLLLAFPAWADDAPRKLRAFPITAGYIATEPGWFYTDEGKARVDAKLQADAQEMSQLRAEHAALRAEPTLTARGAALLLASGLVLGLVLAVPIALAASKR